MAIILERKLLPIEEFERIYSFKQMGDTTLVEYIQDERFDKCKEMFLGQYDDKQKNKLEMKKREVSSNVKRKSATKNR